MTLLFALPVAPLQAQPEPSLNWFNQGVELQRKGDYEAARLAYEKALALNPQRGEALGNLGLVYLQLGAPEQAAASLTKALALNPQLASVRFYLGLAHFRAGQFEAAERELTTTLQQQQGNAQTGKAQTQHLLGLCLLKLNRVTAGIAALEAALQNNPTNLEAAYTLAVAYAGRGEIERVEALLKGPLRAVNNAEVYLVRGIILKSKGQHQQAVEAFTHAVQLNPKLPTLHFQLGSALMSLGQLERAMEEYRVELALNPQDFNANSYLGWLLLQERRYDEAASLLKEALRQQPDNSGLLYLLGQLHYATGNHPQAAELIERSVKLDPNQLPAHVLLARVYAKLKRAEDVAREQIIIRRLTQAEQERNVRSHQSYGTQELTLPGAAAAPAKPPARPQENR